MTEHDNLRPLIEAAFRDRSLLEGEEHRSAVFATIAALDAGRLRVDGRRVSR